MNIIPTELNERLAGAIRNRMSAEGILIFGKVGFWHLLGVGLIIFGTGSAIGLGFYGYSQIARSTENLNILSSMLSKSLAESQLKAIAEGTIQVEPPDLYLAKGQTVALADDSRVSLDRSATILANGDITVQIPSISAPASITPRSTGKTPLVTNFTVFKSVPFGKGAVMTGWVFLTSAQTAPTHQYCYYTASLETPGFDINVDVGSDGQLDSPKTMPRDFDINAAFSKCVWFRKQ